MKSAVKKLYNSLYGEHPRARRVLLDHSRAVRDLACRAAGTRGLDMDLVQTGAMLHDIGIIRTHAPAIGCMGEAPYLMHGVIGQKILQDAGLNAEGEIALRHVGVAITAEEIRAANLPLPAIDMQPRTAEEECIAWADTYFSKRPEYLIHPKPTTVVEAEIARFGTRPLAVFRRWEERFGPVPL
ncbi:MAG: HDIG domain-containing metalloprotein [Fibrobacterota bacterium]